MDFGFYFIYIGFPLIISAGLILTTFKRNEKRKLFRRSFFTAFKGIFYIYIAVTLIFSKESIRTVTGLTISLALMEGISAIVSASSDNK
jgi:hypothetical protein